MQFKEYQTQALTTRIYPNVGSNYQYCFFGLIGEFGEVVEKLNTPFSNSMFNDTSDLYKKELAKEIGDVMWYIAGLDDELQLNCSISYDTNVYINSLNISKKTFKLDTVSDVDKITTTIGKISEIIKKAIRDSEGVISTEKIDLIRTYLTAIHYFIIGIAAFMGISIDQVMQDNIDKLQSRKDRGVLGGSGDNR
jgi:hypothetical protein